MKSQLYSTTPVLTLVVATLAAHAAEQCLWA